MKPIEQLRELYQEVVKSEDKTKLSELSNLMQSESIQKIISEEVKNQDNSNLSDLTLILQCANIIDNNSGLETGMNDSTYDILYDKMNRMYDLFEEAKNTAADMFENIWFTTPVISSNNKVPHTYIGLRGTLDKIYYLTLEDGETKKINKTRKGLPHYIKTIQHKLARAGREDIDVYDLDVYVFPKFDGLSCIFEYDADGNLLKALTRGDVVTNMAEDVTHLFDFWVKGEKRDHPYGIKTEIHMDESDYLKFNEKYNTNFKSSRQIVSSIMNSDKPDKRVEFIRIVPLRIAELVDGKESKHYLHPGVFKYPFIKCKLSETDKIEEFAMSHKYASGLRCDGVVIHIIDETVQDILGRENDRDKFEVAYKFTEEIAYSKVKDIKFNPGIFGNIVPTVEFEPVVLKGNTVSNASLGSYAIASNYSLAKGDVIRIHYDIIPTIVFDENDPKCKRSGKSPIKFPVNCPECGQPLTYQDSIMMCTNLECDCRKRGRILNFCQSMGLTGIGEETVEDLYFNNLINDIEDLYKLEKRKKEILEIPGYGKKSVSLILSEIERSKNTDILTILNSIGIKGIRGKTFKKVFDSGISYDELLSISELNEVSRLVNINGIGETTATLIIGGLNQNKKLLKFLDKHLTIDKKTSQSKDTNKKFSVAFTTIRDDDLEKYIVHNGGVVSDSVTKTTDVLIVPMVGVTSGKVTKAEKYGVPIVPIDDAYAYIEEHFLK